MGSELDEHVRVKLTMQRNKAKNKQMQNVLCGYGLKIMTMLPEQNHGKQFDAWEQIGNEFDSSGTVRWIALDKLNNSLRVKWGYVKAAQYSSSLTYRQVDISHTNEWTYI
jgi:hypothetical protein